MPEISDQQLEAVLETFRGEGEQVPSMFSALKKDGKKLYELAREGVEVEREARPIHIFDLTVTDRGSIGSRCGCIVPAGTYVRSLVEDIGRALDCGAMWFNCAAPMWPASTLAAW